jgi:DNA-binding response OmpR family regulator
MGSTGSLARHSIVLLEDDVGLVDLLRLQLTKRGATVTAFRKYFEYAKALDVEHHATSPRLSWTALLVDRSAAAGFHLGSLAYHFRLRAQPSAVVAYMSAGRFDPEVQACVRAGIVDEMPKPFEIDELVTLLIDRVVVN